MPRRASGAAGPVAAKPKGAARCPSAAAGPQGTVSWTATVSSGCPAAGPRYPQANATPIDGVHTHMAGPARHLVKPRSFIRLLRRAETHRGFRGGSRGCRNRASCPKGSSAHVRGRQYGEATPHPAMLWGGGPLVGVGTQNCGASGARASPRSPHQHRPTGAPQLLREGAPQDRPRRAPPPQTRSPSRGLPEPDSARRLRPLRRGRPPALGDPVVPLRFAPRRCVACFW